jgi:osmotically-inducible protein OsmY
MAPTTPRSDQELQSAVLEELKWVPNFNSAHIGVNADGGAVTLSGEVRSYPERLLAERAALRVRGVVALACVLVGRNESATSNDSDIARDAAEALERAGDVPSDTVKAVVTNRHIVLTGTVTWHYQREAAERAVRYVSGVFGVSNGLTLKPTVSAAGLKSSITAALVRNAQLEGSEIRVSTAAGEITLEGSVPSWADRHEADKAAWSAPGVTAVTNLIRVSA